MEVDGKFHFHQEKKSVLHREVGNTYILYVYVRGVDAGERVQVGHKCVVCGRSYF